MLNAKKDFFCQPKSNLSPTSYKLNWGTVIQIEKLCIGLFNKMNSRREVQITILSNKIVFPSARKYVILDNGVGKTPFLIVALI